MIRHAIGLAFTVAGGALAALYLPFALGLPLALAWGALCGHVATIKPEDVRQAGYMRRWRLWDAWGILVFVHRIDADDPDRHRHDHPFKGFSLILRGGYWEAIGWPKLRKRTPGSIVPLQPRKYHRLTHVIPGTLTITFARRVPGGWGFLVRGKHVPAAEYLACEKAGRS